MIGIPFVNTKSQIDNENIKKGNTYMKTWEMVKMFTESPNLRFKSKTDGSILALYKDIMFWDGNLSYVPELNIFEEWELVRESVPVWEAVKAICEGKKIYCECFKESGKVCKFNDYLSPMSYVGCITSGKWFIED